MEKEKQNKNTDFRKIKMRDLFDDEEREDLEILLDNRDWKGLRKWLNYKEDKLLKKGIDAEYLYYYVYNIWGG